MACLRGADSKCSFSALLSCVLKVKAIEGAPEDSTIVLSAGTDGRIAVWDWRNGAHDTPALSLTLHQSGINGLAARLTSQTEGTNGSFDSGVGRQEDLSAT